MGRRRGVVNQKTLCAFRKNRRLAALRALRKGKKELIVPLHEDQKENLNPNVIEENVMQIESEIESQPGCSTAPVVPDCSLSLYDHTYFKTSTSVSQPTISQPDISGIGYSQVEELCAVLNMPCMAMKTYSSQHEKMSEVILSSAWETMTKAAREEAEHARNIGNVDEDGIPYITVVTDGAWAKRSYNLNYNASSGVACIIGLYTGKLLFLGIRNKYCSVCFRRPGGEEIPHTCYKNWSDSSTAMESDIIVEGFRTSLQIHGLKFLKMVGDGDSSVYKRLLETKPYGNKLVQKIECINHLLRNFSKRLREISNRKRSQTKNLPVHPFLRKALLNRLLRFKTGISNATEHRGQQPYEFMEKVRLLQSDLENIPSHIFGEHSRCSEIGYFNCKPALEEKNLMPLMRECGLDQDIRVPLQRLMDNCSSLLLNMKNNVAEQFNRIVCKFVGGKRVNFSLRGSYKTRCEAAALSFNVGGDYYGTLHKNLAQSSPKNFTKKYIERMKKRRMLKKKWLFKPKAGHWGRADKDYYGPEANSLVLSLYDKDYIERKTKFLKSLKKTKDDIQKIAIETVGQSTNPQWIQERSLRLTASNFGTVSKRRKTSSTATLVKSVLYSNFLGTKATKYGDDNEPLARRQLQEKLSLSIYQCGFYMHPTEYYLGASPDGLIGENGIVEIKCPASISKLHPLDAINEKNLNFAPLLMDIQKLITHNYYYQVQG